MKLVSANAILYVLGFSVVGWLVSLTDDDSTTIVWVLVGGAVGWLYWRWNARQTTRT